MNQFELKQGSKIICEDWKPILIKTTDCEKLSSVQVEVKEPEISVVPETPEMPQMENVVSPTPPVSEPELAAAQPPVSEVAPVQSDFVQPSDNIFDTPDTFSQREENLGVSEARVETIPAKDVSVEEASMDFDTFLMESNKILQESQRKQVELTMRLVDSLRQSQSDKQAYETAIDEIVQEPDGMKLAS